MIALILLALNLVASPFESKSRLEAENAALRQQLIVLRRKVHGRVQLSRGDRLFFVQLYRWFPSIIKVIAIVRPETLVRWHRAGFRRASDYRGIPVERGTTVSDPRSGWDLWQRSQAPVAGDGDPRQADFGWFAVAELFCRTADWLYPPRMR
jgi:hypothetical protein